MEKTNSFLYFYNLFNADWCMLLSSSKNMASHGWSSLFYHAFINDTADPSVETNDNYSSIS